MSSRVLVVDDEPAIASLVSMCLDSFDVEVIQALGLAGAREALLDGGVALVLLDLALGIEDGLEILPYLRAEPQLSQVPVVAFSAHDSRRDEALKQGVDSFLSRPFSAVDLQQTVRHYLAR